MSGTIGTLCARRPGFGGSSVLMVARERYGDFGESKTLITEKPDYLRLAYLGLYISRTYALVPNHSYLLYVHSVTWILLPRTPLLSPYLSRVSRVLCSCKKLMVFL